MPNCRIYHANRLKAFDPGQPFSTVGGCGDLYRASHVEDGELALKRLRWGTGDLTDHFALATEEAGVWQVLRHPNVLAFLGILYSKPHIYLVSPFAPHGSLPNYLVAHPDADRTTFILHVAAGLAYLHSQNVIHGDVKGANILVSGRFTAQLCDFGLSKFADTATSNGATARSIPWLSPERMDRADSPRTRESDVYAFGMTIYEILSGHIPFHTLGVDALVIAVCIRDERPPASPDVSTTGTSYMDLWLLAGNCWNKDPGRRLSMEQVYTRIAPGDMGTGANTGWADAPPLSEPPSSSDIITLRRKRSDTVLDTMDTASGSGMLHDFERGFPQTAELTQNEWPTRAAKRPKVSKSSESTAYASLSAQDPHGKDTDSWLTTAIHHVEVALREIFDTTSVMASTAGSTVGKMASTGLNIIEILKNVERNWKQAMELGRHTGTLIQCVARFLESPISGLIESCDAHTSTQLDSFISSLKALEKTLAEFHMHDRPNQAISRQISEDTLIKWEAMINRAFTTLQIQLSLHSLCLVTNLSDTSARLERDRLLGLLGDGDIGATEKASSAVDLMCLPGTRTSALDQVDQWISNPSGSRIFWISGVAGCGKSALAATIAGRPRAIPTSIAVFYFVRGNQERNKRVLCSLSRQLVQFGHGSLEPFVLSAVKARPDIATLHLDTQFEHLIIGPLKKLVPGLPPIILVVDALDEWDNQSAVVKLIDLIKHAPQFPSTIRFVLASRNEPHLVRPLDNASARGLVTRYELDGVLKSEAGRDIRTYIEKHFAEICAESEIAAGTWPKVEDIDGLVMLSDGLFQWAATVMSYIEARRSQGRLRQILDNPERYRGLDNLYRGVLDRSSGEEMDEQVSRLLQDVLGAILSAPAPRNATIIGYLCCDHLDTLEETMELVWEEVLPILASMFLIPKDRTQPITVSHKSVLDYLTNKDRCTDVRFYTDLVIHKERIAHSCFRLMGSKLKQDLCGINDPSKLNKDVQDQVLKQISPGLRYFCEHWVEYLVTPGQDGFAVSREGLDQFSQNHLLHWLEVMSLIGLMERVVPLAQDVERWLSACPSLSLTGKLTRRLWGDIQRFVAMFLDPISTAAPHIYISALRLAPMETQLMQQYATTTERGIRVTGGLQGKQWPPPPWIGHGHKAAVRCAAFSPDGRSILSGSDDSTLRLWDPESGDRKGRALIGHTGPVLCASFSPDGKSILSGSDDKTLRIWDPELRTQKGEALQGHKCAVQCASFSPDGRSILSGSDDSTLRLWDPESSTQESRTLKGHRGGVGCASFSPDGKTILSGSRDKTLLLWDTGSGAQKSGTWMGHKGTVKYASFSPDGGTILSGSYDKTLLLWDARSGARKGGMKGHTSLVLAVSFSPDGKKIVTGSYNNTLQICDVKSGVLEGRTFKGHTGGVECVSFSPDGRTILSGSDDGTIRIWNVDSGALKAEPWNGHTRGVSCFAFSPDGTTIISGSFDKTVRLWDAETGDLKGEPLSAEGVVSGLSFSNDGLTLIGTTYDASSQEWDLMKYAHTEFPMRRPQVFEGSISSDGWVLHRKIRWFWMPFFYADWLLCGNRLALRHERVVYIIDVSEIMYIVE